MIQEQVQDLQGRDKRRGKRNERGLERRQPLSCKRQGSLSSFWFCQPVKREQLLIPFSIRPDMSFSFRGGGVSYSFTRTSGARLMSDLEPGVIRINCLPTERRAASI